MVTTTTLTMDTDFISTGFKKIPNFLKSVAEFCSLKSIQKYIYAIFSDRAELSKVNEWAEENGEVYILFSYKSMQEEFGLSEPTLRRHINALVKVGLLKVKRQGQGNPNKIFVKGIAPEAVEEPQKEVEQDSKNEVKSELKTKKMHKKVLLPNDAQSTEERQFTICYNNSKTKINPSESIKDLDIVDFGQNYSISLENVKEKINYAELIKNTAHVDLINSLANCILDVMTTTAPTIWINKHSMLTVKAIEVYEQLTQKHIEDLIKSYVSLPHKVDKPDQYLKTMLFNQVKKPAGQVEYENKRYGQDRLGGASGICARPTAFNNFEQQEWTEEELKDLEE